MCIRDSDWLEGGDGNDDLQAGAGDDLVDGGPGNDKVSGGEGDDTIADGPGNDRISGDAGDDQIKLGPGRDTVFGEEGTNVVRATSDGSVDTIYCGSGPADTLIYDVEMDPLDVVEGCETVELAL